jgi:hypothetical protein
MISLEFDWGWGINLSEEIVDSTYVDYASYWQNAGPEGSY